MKHARFALAALLLLAPTLVLAQAQGRVKGTVSDSQGKPIANAKITITCPAVASFKKEVSADSKGQYATLIVDATKRYLFHVDAPGFQSVEREDKPLIGGQTLELNFTLKSGKEVEQEAEAKAMEAPGIKELREGKDLLDAGNKQGARDKFAAAVAAKPDLYLGWLQLSILDLEAGKADIALTEAEKCLAIAPNIASCLASAANAAKAKGDTAAFDKYMTAYKAANPDDPTVIYNEAVAFLNKGDDAKARPLLEKVVELDPNYADGLFQLGMVYLRAGENPKAKELLGKFLEVAPNHKEAPTAKEMLKYL